MTSNLKKNYKGIDIMEKIVYFNVNMNDLNDVNGNYLNYLNNFNEIMREF